MAKIKELLEQITDKTLRSRLEAEIDLLAKNKKFGLVFEEHIPECVPLYSVPIKIGGNVAVKTSKMQPIYEVLDINGDMAHCMDTDTKAETDIPLDTLVSVALFGEVIFPSLEPIASVCNAPDSKLWHTIIEADNYHALQLLGYLYAGQVDCIYIDPPYNTGARDWKYNNDYVDSNDSFRHSKWLSMMKKRLELAKKVLKPDTGVLVCAIDKHEVHTLGLLIEEIFTERESHCVTVVHNPGGTQGKNFSYCHEYAIFVIPTIIQSIGLQDRTDNPDIRPLRDVSTGNHLRTDAKNCFYPIYVKNNSIIGFGDVCDDLFHPKSPNIVRNDGVIEIYPIDAQGNERKWVFARQTVETIMNELHVVRNNKRGILDIIRHKTMFNFKTVWTGEEYNANAHGTKLLTRIIPNCTFDFPKSIYTIKECVAAIVRNNKNALILDFFAGSGTTLHAVNLLNAEDNGNRRCILVTNNEVSSEETKTLTEQGYQPSDPEWERHGICRSVTWPRTEYSILGKRSDGTLLTGEYFTNQTITKETSRNFYQLGFIDDPATLTLPQKKQIVALLGKDKLPQSQVKADSAFALSEKHTASILFDTSALDDWLAALEETDHITDFYIVTKEKRLFDDIKAKITDILGNITITEPLKRPMSEGFPANCEYFKLNFLDRTSVSLGQQFREILPLLWLKSGAIGERPVIEDSNDDLPPYMINHENAFAVMLDEDYFNIFLKKIQDETLTIFLVTNSDEAFKEMAQQIKAKNIYQLYKDYIDNFMIGSRRDSQ